MSISTSTPNSNSGAGNAQTCTVYSVVCDDIKGIRAKVFCSEIDALCWLAEYVDGPDESTRAESPSARP
jgi:hypothetical protein